MKMFGSWSELVSILFRKNSQNVTLRPNQSTTYTADRTFDLPPGDSSQVLTSATSTQTLTNKSIDADTNTITNIDDNEIKAAAAINATKIADGSVDNTEFQRLGTAGTVGAGNLVTTDGTQTLTNKTINADTNTISNIDDNDIKAAAAIDASKISDGSVDNTEFQRLGTAGVNAAGNLVTTTGTQTLTAKSIDGDDNTVTDLALASLKTVLGDANKVIRRDASGVVISGNALPNSSAIVTTDAAQVLTLKDIDGGTATNTSRVTLPKETTTNLNALTRKQGTIVYDTTTNQVKYDDGSTLTTLAAGTTLDGSQDVENLAIATSVAANALTIAIKTKAGADPSSGDPVKIAFRNENSTLGDYSVLTVTSALSIVVPSGATLGHRNGVEEPIYIYALNNAGTVELSVSTTFADYTLRDTTLAMTTGSDSRDVNYSTNARTTKAIRLIGKLLITETTAGTWANNATNVMPLPLPDTFSKTISVAHNTSTYIYAGLRSGTYTPTITGFLNVAATSAYVCQYMQVGNVVTVSGRLDIDPTAAGTLTGLRVSVPITSGANFGSTTSGIGGTFVDGDGTCSGQIAPETAQPTALFVITPTVATNASYWFTFTYNIP